MSDHNDIQLQSIESDDGRARISEVSDSSRRRAGSLQAKDHSQAVVPVVRSIAQA